MLGISPLLHTLKKQINVSEIQYENNDDDDDDDNDTQRLMETELSLSLSLSPEHSGVSTEIK
jgi:hypothetical protein